MDIRRQLQWALKTGYQPVRKREKNRILETFILNSWYHRKSAIRLLNGADIQQALIVLRETSDRLCSKSRRFERTHCQAHVNVVCQKHTSSAFFI